MTSRRTRREDDKDEEQEPATEAQAEEAEPREERPGPVSESGGYILEEGKEDQGWRLKNPPIPPETHTTTEPEPPVEEPPPVLDNTLPPEGEPAAEMAVSDAYATAAEYRARVQKGSTTDDANILLDLKAVSRYIEQVTGRFFNKDAAPVARVYNPYYPYNRSGNVVNVTATGVILKVEDIATLTGLSVLVDTAGTGSFAGLTPLAPAAFQVEPLNAPLGPEPQPYTQLVIPAWSSAAEWSSAAPVQVTAVWGWPAVPEAIKRGCIDLTGILRLETPRAEQTVNVSLNQVFSITKRGQNIVEDLIAKYAKFAPAVA